MVYVSDSLSGHEAGTGGSIDGTPPGIQVPAASTRFTGRTGFGVATP